MELYVVGLAVLTAAAWGAGSPLSKLGLERGGTPYQVALTVVFVSVVVYWIALIARGENVLGHSLWVLGLFIVTGVFATAMARALSFAGVERLGASINSAGVNTRPVWASILAVVFLGEAITLQMGLGIVVVVFGLIALAFSEGGDVSGWELHQLAFPLTAALTFGAGNVARRYAFEATSITALEGVAINETAGLFGMLVYLFIRNGRIAEMRDALAAPPRAYVFFVGSGLLNALALFTLFEALSQGRVVIVDPLSSPTSLFAILFTFLFLRRVERVTRRLLVGAVLVITGVVLITGPQILWL